MPLSRDVPLSEQLRSDDSSLTGCGKRNATRVALFQDAQQPEEYIDFDVPATEPNNGPHGPTKEGASPELNKHFDDVENRRKALLRSLMAKRSHETVLMTRDAVNVIAGPLSSQLDAPLLYKQ